MRALDVKSRRTAYRSPWRNGVAERWIGSCRRELLDRVIILHEDHLRRLLREYVEYYSGDRCHLALEKDSPEMRSVQPRPSHRARAGVLADDRSHRQAAPLVADLATFQHPSNLYIACL